MDSNRNRALRQRGRVGSRPPSCAIFHAGGQELTSPLNPIWTLCARQREAHTGPGARGKSTTWNAGHRLPPEISLRYGFELVGTTTEGPTSQTQGCRNIRVRSPPGAVDQLRHRPSEPMLPSLPELWLGHARNAVLAIRSSCSRLAPLMACTVIP